MADRRARRAGLSGAAHAPRSIALTGPQVSVLATPFFLALIAIEIVVGRRRRRDTYRLNDALGSIAAGDHRLARRGRRGRRPVAAAAVAAIADPSVFSRAEGSKRLQQGSE